MSNSSIRPIDRTPSGTTTPGQSGPGSDGYEGLLHIPPNSSFAGVTSSDCLVSYPGHKMGGGLTRWEGVYSRDPADWAARINTYTQI